MDRQIIEWHVYKIYNLCVCVHLYLYVQFTYIYIIYIYLHSVQSFIACHDSRNVLGTYSVLGREREMPTPLHTRFHVILVTTLESKNCWPHFTNNESEARRD